MHNVANAFEAAYAKESEADADPGEPGDSGMGQEAGLSASGSASSAVLPAGEASPQRAGKRRRRRKHPLVPAMFDVTLMRALWTLYKGQFLRVGAIRFVNTSVQFLPAILVQRLLR